MTDETSRDRILKAVKERIRASDEQDRLRLITDIVGDRRHRDLVDVIAQIEQEEGWSSALSYLLKIRGKKYSSPLTLGSRETALEDLKYREVVFRLLSCSGLEPVIMDSSTMLKELDSECSLVDASRTLLTKLETLASDQILAGDTLFFDFLDNTSVSQDIKDLLQQTRRYRIKDIELEKNGTTIDILPLWHSELSRLALAHLGISGNRTDSETLLSVLSVIQEPVAPLEELIVKRTEENNFTNPSNEDYGKLLTFIINQDVEGLGYLASRHGLPTLNILVDEATSQYRNSESTPVFKQILQYINAHIAIRSIESVIVLEKTSKMKDTRIATMAILAMGNFYHESAVTALVDILCSSKNRGIVDTAVKSIQTIHKRCLETDHVIAERLTRECTNRGRLLKLQRSFPKKRYLYYQ